MLIEDGERGTERIPDTVQALIAARIDRLPTAAKAVLQHGAVIGRVFWLGAIEALSPGVSDADEALDDLVERDFLSAEARSSISGEHAYRFKHVLIREVAYAGITKGDRAQLHRRFAEWLKERAVDELIEIRAYHLDEAARLHEELDGRVPADLASEAAEALQRAGRRALAREANRPGRNLLRRAVELEPTLERRYDAARASWRLADLPTVSDEMEQVRELAATAGDARIEGASLTALAEVALLRDADLPRGRELVERALELLGDEPSENRFDALENRAMIAWWLGDLDENEHYARLARDVARSLGRRDLEASALDYLAGSHIVRLDLETATELLAAAIELSTASGNPVSRAWALYTQSRISELQGDLDQAERAADEAREAFAQAGVSWGFGRVLNRLGWIARKRGDLKASERWFREAIQVMKGIEDRGTLCESQRALAQLLVQLGRLEEAEQLALEARKTVGRHDQASRATTRMALGIVRAAQGRDEEAESLLREALEVIERTDARLVCREVLEALVEFLRGRGREADAAGYEAELVELRPAVAA
jgi:tetratricopeptide (TPR) repeat protein